MPTFKCCVYKCPIVVDSVIVIQCAIPVSHAILCDVYRHVVTVFRPIQQLSHTKGSDCVPFKVSSSVERENLMLYVNSTIVTRGHRFSLIHIILFCD